MLTKKVDEFMTVMEWPSRCHLQSTFQRIFLVESLSESLIRSKTVCSFCFWAISDCVTSATLSFSPSSFSESHHKQKEPFGSQSKEFAPVLTSLLRDFWSFLCLAFILPQINLQILLLFFAVVKSWRKKVEQLLYYCNTQWLKIKVQRLSVYLSLSFSSD